MPKPTVRACLSVLVLLSLLGAVGAGAQEDAEKHPIDALELRPIGPAVMGGRIVDIAAVDGDTFFVAAATGNLWKTTNRGTTWEPLFEHEEVNSIGEILEVNQVCAYFNYSNRLLNGLGVSMDGDSVGYYQD